VIVERVTATCEQSSTLSHIVVLQLIEKNQMLCFEFECWDDVLRKRIGWRSSETNQSSWMLTFSIDNDYQNLLSQCTFLSVLRHDLYPEINDIGVIVGQLKGDLIIEFYRGRVYSFFYITFHVGDYIFPRIRVDFVRIIKKPLNRLSATFSQANSQQFRFLNL